MAKKTKARNSTGGRPTLKLVMGLQSIRTPRYASERAFVNSANESMRRIERAVIDIINQVEDAAIPIMKDALEPTLELAKHYCPKDTHALVNSGYIEPTSFRGKPRVEVGFAKGGNPPYGAYVHEAVDVPHKQPTQAKFLERAMVEDLDAIGLRLRQGYRQFMRGR